MKHLIPKIRFPLTLISLVISLVVISISHGATLKWNPNSEEDLVEGYILWFGLSSEEYSWPQDVGNVTKYEIPTSWPEDYTYYVAIKAYNSSGYSEFSDEIDFRTNGDTDFDGIPDDEDNCPDNYNPEQENNDNDDWGDVCDPDDDNDGVDDFKDNCSETPNGYFYGTCKSGDLIGIICIFDSCGSGGLCSKDQEDTDDDGLGDVCDPDADGDVISNDQDDFPFDPDNDIDNDNIGGDVDNCPKVYNPDQENTYPPGGNGCGDACKCFGDFESDGDVDGTDMTKFMEDMARYQYNDPCTNGTPCNGDFDCDGDVDGSDMTKFMEDLGRSLYNDPCPLNCQTGSWCTYDE